MPYYKRTRTESMIARALKEWNFSYVMFYTFNELRTANGARTGYSFGILDTTYTPYQLLLLLDVHYANAKETSRKNYVLKERFARDHQLGLVTIEDEVARTMEYAQFRDWLAMAIEQKEFKET